MLNYDFCNLFEPIRFQHLAKDIIQVREKCIMELFAPTGDLGVDMRGNIEGKVVIGQVKRRSNYQALKQDLKQELEKVKKLNPDRYLFITSVAITTAQKNQIIEMMEGYILQTKDILGKEDLNNLLALPEYKPIRKKYPELFLNDADLLEEMLDRVINRGIYESSRMELKEILKNEKTYVESKLYEEAIDILNQYNTILITGEAGMGKTSLARHLCYKMLQNNNDINFYYLYDLEEILEVYEERKNQIFFLDDFWGSIFKSKTDKKEEKRFLDIIHRIEEDDKKKLVLTSRQSILVQGFHEHPKMKTNLNEENSGKIVLRLEEFTEFFKTEILLKHLKQTNFTWNETSKFVTNRKEITESENYNPRLICSFMQKESKRKNKKQNIYEEFIEYLNHPKSFIEDLFHEQSQTAQILLILILVNGGSCYLEELEVMYYDFVEKTNCNLQKKDFKMALNQLKNDLVYERKQEDDWVDLKKAPTLILFQNPSIKEFVYEYFIENLNEFLEDIIKSTRYLNVLVMLLGSQNHYLEKDIIGIWEKCNQNVIRGKIENKVIQDYESLIFTFHKTEFDSPLENEYSDFDKLTRIMQIEEKIQSEKIQEFIQKKIVQLFQQIKNKERKFTYTDRLYIFDLLKKMQKKKIVLPIEITDLLEIYTSEIVMLDQYRLIEQFYEIYPEETMDFFTKNRDKIRNKIEKGLLPYIYELKNRGYYLELEQFRMLEYKSLQEMYGVVENRKINEIIVAILQKQDYEIEEENEESDNTIKIKKEEHEKMQEEILEQEIIEILGEELLLSNKEIEKRIEKEIQCKKTKNWLNTNLYDIKNWLILQLLKGPRTFEIVSNILNKKQAIMNPFELVENVLEKILEKDKKPGKLEKIQEICFTCLKEGKTIFSKEELQQEVSVSEEFIQDLLQKGILMKNHKWIEFENFAIPVYFFVQEGIKQKVDFQKLLNQMEKEGTSIDPFQELIIMRIWNQYDRKNFNEKYLKTNLEKFLKTIDTTTNKTICMSFLYPFEISVNWKEKELESWYGNQVSDLLELIDCEPFTILEKIPKDGKYEKYLPKIEEHEDLNTCLFDMNLYTILEKIGVIDAIFQKYLEIKKILEELAAGKNYKNYIK